MTDPDLIRIHFYGLVKDTIGSDYVDIAVTSAGEAIHALCHQYPGFKQVWNNNGWHIVTTKQGTNDAPDPLRASELITGIQGRDLHIIPAADGAILGSLKKLWKHVVMPLITLPFEAVRKVMQQMMPTVPDAGKWEPAENKPSFGLSRAVNVSTEGLPIPLNIGKIPASGFVISNDRDTVQL